MAYVLVWSSALAAIAFGSLISTFVCSMTKLAQIMKNITSCNTRSSSGVKFGSHFSRAAVTHGSQWSGVSGQWTVNRRRPETREGSAVG